MKGATTPLLVATNNAHKLREIAEMLGPRGFDVRGPRELGLSLDPEEWGETFGHNAAIKALNGLRMSDEATLADDSGLEVDALGGKPGVYSARFAGEAASDDANNRKVAALLADTAASERACRFRCVMALAWYGDESPELHTGAMTKVETLAEVRAPGAYRLSEPVAAQLAGGALRGDVLLLLCTGTLEGHFAESARGSGGFGYDPWVELADGRRVAELASDEKNAISHRGEALRALVAALDTGPSEA